MASALWFQITSLRGADPKSHVSQRFREHPPKAARLVKSSVRPLSPAQILAIRGFSSLSLSLSLNDISSTFHSLFRISLCPEKFASTAQRPRVFEKRDTQTEFLRSPSEKAPRPARNRSRFRQRGGPLICGGSNLYVSALLCGVLSEEKL